MSDYLHRLTQAVREPSQRIRPLVGSLYAPADVGEADLAPAAPARADLREGADTTAPQDPYPPRTIVAGRVNSPASSSSIADHDNRKTQLLAPAVTTPHVTPDRRTHALRSQHDREPGPIAPAHTVHATQLSTSTETATRRYEPLMPATNAPSPVAPVPDDHKARAQSPTAATASTRHVRSQDDIQIHIGRIEVAAVTPPPGLAPMRSPRKAASLDDYLRRRDGRLS